MATPQQASRLSVQVVCSGTPLFLKTMLVPRGQTVGWCVNASGLWALHPERKPDAILAIGGHRVSPETCVVEGDRIEVLRPVSVEAQAKVRMRGKSR